MSGFKGIFKGKDTNTSVANALAKDYQKKATKTFKQLLKEDSDARLFTGFAIGINSIVFKTREVGLVSESIEDIFKTKLKNIEEIYKSSDFIRPEDLIKENYWFLGRDFDEIQDFIKALEKAKYTLMWKLDADRHNYLLYPVFFVN